MNFLERALPLIQRGLFVIPVAAPIPGDRASGKNPLIPNWQNSGTIDRNQIEAWDSEWPNANAGVVANGVVMLDDDRGDLKEKYEAETGRKFPSRTFTVMTSTKPTGMRGYHYYFESTVETHLLGNRKLAGVYDFQCERRQVVGPNSVHWTGSVYEPINFKAPFVPMPQELCAWIERTSDAVKPQIAAGDGPAAHEDWNCDEWMEFYEDVFTCHQDGEWWVASICPATYEGEGTGRKHGDSNKTGFRFDGPSPQFHCFNTACPGYDMTFGQVVKHLNQYHEKYPGKIWADGEDDDDDILEWLGAEASETMPEVPLAEASVANGDVAAAAPATAQETALTAEPAGVAAAPNKEYEIHRAPNPKGGYSAIVGIRMEDVEAGPVVWLWPGRLPLGKALVISGAPGTNKSMLSLALVTCVTNGWNWPDGEANTMGPQDVLIAATEDDLETTIKPRLMAMGAGMTRITAIKNVVNLDENGKKKSRELNLEADTNNLFQLLRANPRIRMVVLDPLTGFYGGTDGNDNKKIRPMLQKIAKVCHLTGAAFVLLIHENKRSEANATDRMLGAGAVSQVVRAGIRISKDPKNKPDGRIMANIKTSQSRDNGGMKFSVASKDVESESGLLKDIGYIEWGEKHTMSADDVLDEERAFKKEGGAEDTKLGQAVRIFEEALKHGPKLHRDVHPLLDAANISDETKRRARWKAGVRSSKSAPWYWWLPGHGGPTVPQAVIEQKIEVVEVM
jgi:hypothetical protein